VTFVYTPGNAFVVSDVAQDFRGANNYRPNLSLRGRSSSGSR
jgi:hypothetical protein